MTRSLFEAGEAEPVRVRDMHIGPVPPHEVDLFCRRYHYTLTAGNASWRWGLWHSATLYGVVAYNLPTRSVCMSVFGEEHGADRVWHMGRLVLSDAAPRNSESRLIGASLRAIKRERPEVWAVVTYAAIDQGHIGTVYQATNALYTGLGGTGGGSGTYHYRDAQGRAHSNVQGGRMIPTADAAARGWRRVESQPKHRYVYLLGSRRERQHRRALLRLPVLPYPKALPELGLFGGAA